MPKPVSAMAGVFRLFSYFLNKIDARAIGQTKIAK